MLPKAPAACADLDLAQVSRVLARHCGDIPASARELNIAIPDLRRLTWSKPDLLEEAELARMEVIARAWGQLIEALYSDDPRRQMWASDKIMSSYMARDHPLAPARRGATGESRTIVFRWADGALAADELERDGRTLARYGDDPVTPPASRTGPMPSPPQSPIWRGPPPQVRPLWVAPKAPAPRSDLRRPSRGGWR